MIKLLSIGVAAAFAALSIFDMTSAQAQSATSCPGGSDPTASDCLFILDPTGAQLSFLGITEQDELDNPGKIWSIGGVVPTNPSFLNQWIELTEPVTGDPSDVVGVISTPNGGTAIAFVSDPADFSVFDIVGLAAEKSTPFDASFLLDPTSQADGFKVFFQSDLDATVPEPATWAMMVLGFAGLGFARYRSSRVAVSIAA